MHENVSEQNEFLEDELDKRVANIPKSMHSYIKRCFPCLEETQKYNTIPLLVGSTNQQAEFSGEEALRSLSATSVQ